MNVYKMYPAPVRRAKSTPGLPSIKMSGSGVGTKSFVAVRPLPLRNSGLAIAIVKPADALGTGMAGTDRPASPFGGGAGSATIGRNVADRQRLAAVLNGRGHGFKDGHGYRVARL